MENWTCVYTTDQLFKAEAVKDFLAAESIEAVVMNKRDSSYFFGDVELFVDDKNADRAVELINGFKIE